MRKIKKSKAKKSLANTKPVAKKKKKATRAKATRAASTRAPNFSLVIPAKMKTELASRAKSAGMSNWKAYVNNLLNLATTAP